MDFLMRQEARIYRAKTLSSADGPTFAEVVDGAGAPLPLKVKLEEIGARPVTKDGAEQTIDATLLFYVGTKPSVLLQDLVVIVDKASRKGDGRVFRIERLETNRPLGSSKYLAKAGLAKTTAKLPEVMPIGE